MQLNNPSIKSKNARRDWDGRRYSYVFVVKTSLTLLVTLAATVLVFWTPSALVDNDNDNYIRSILLRDGGKRRDVDVSEEIFDGGLPDADPYVQQLFAGLCQDRPSNMTMTTTTTSLGTGFEK